MRGYRPVTLEVTAAVSSTQVPAIGAASGRGPHDGCPIQASERVTPRRRSYTAEQIAQQVVHLAIRDGLLPSPDRCEACDTQPRPWAMRAQLQWHHYATYEPADWLKVCALCPSCHRLVHTGRIPEPRTGEVRTGDRRSRVKGEPARAPRPLIPAPYAREVRELLATIGRPTPAPTPPRDHSAGPATLRTASPPSRGGLAYTPPSGTPMEAP